MNARHPVEAQGRIEEQLLGISIIGLVHKKPSSTKAAMSVCCASESQAKERITSLHKSQATSAFFVGSGPPILSQK